VWRWLLLAVGLLALHTVGQAFTAGPISDRCVHRSDAARYQWDHLEWRWLPIPGAYCVWTDTATGRKVSAWAAGPLPDEHLKSHPTPPENCKMFEPSPDDEVACFYVDEDGRVAEDP
jgi:hypothetical protein